MPNKRLKIASICSTHCQCYFQKLTTQFTENVLKNPWNYNKQWLYKWQTAQNKRAVKIY